MEVTMRLRNIRGAKEFIAASPFVIQNPSEYKGTWNLLFQNGNPIHLEIGMGKGQFIHQLAKQNPNINYIGIEKFSSVLYRALEKRETFELNNLYYLRMEAEILPDIFAQDEISQIYLNFSDPWPKERHAKRRLTSPEFLKRYEPVLRTGGKIIFKTDNRSLFDFSVESIQNTKPWKLESITYDLHNSSFVKDNIMTEYECRFVTMGLPIYWFCAYNKEKAGELNVKIH